MATPRGYSSYHGRSPKWKIFLVILLILVILFALGIMVLQKYLVYDGSGVPHLKLPEKTAQSSSSEKSSGSSAKSKDDLNIKIDKPAEETVKAFQLSDLPLTDWTSAQSRLTQSAAGYNTVSVTVKDSSGAVYYDSAAAAAVSSYAVKAGSGTAAAIQSLTSSDYNSIARLSCFRDPIASKNDLTGKGLKNTGGYIFYDGNSENWMDPSKQGTQKYLAALAKECADLGFKEILLTDFTYPTAGKLNKIDYGTGERSENLKACLTAIKAALNGTDVKLSVELPSSVITGGSDANAGLVLTEIAPLVDRIYAQTDAAGASALSAAVTSANKSTVFVPEVTGTLSDSGFLTLN